MRIHQNDGTEHSDVQQRRDNADAADDGTTVGRLYSRLLHVQIDLQEADDEPAEDLLIDIIDCFPEHL